jgi:hypothetical protein
MISYSIRKSSSNICPGLANTMNNRFRGTRRHRFEDVYKQMTKFEFHEAQQSHEYNVGKVQRGYYSADPDGKVEKVIDRVMTQHMVDGTKEDSLEPEPTDETPKYLPSLELSDPIIAAMLKVCKVEQVKGFEMLDSRWNGNEGTNHTETIQIITLTELPLAVFKYDTLKGSLFVKLNRVEDVSVFMSEALSLTSLLKTETVRVPKALHIGQLPKVKISHLAWMWICTLLCSSPR